MVCMIQFKVSRDSLKGSYLKVSSTVEMVIVNLVQSMKQSTRVQVGRLDIADGVVDGS